MTTTVLLQGRAAGGDGKRLLAYLATVLGATRSFEGCRDISVYRDQDDPAFVTVVELWTSRRHYQRYVAWRRDRGEIDIINAHFDSEPSLRFLERVAV